MIAGQHLSGEAERNINEKIRSLSKAKIDEISALIGASFWDHPYEEGEGGLGKESTVYDEIHGRTDVHLEK